MRIAFISDVHGNYSALVSVVEDALANKVDKIVFVGDYVFDLPFSNKVVNYLKNLENATIIKGNKEVYLTNMAIEDQKSWVYDQMGAVYQTYRELSKESFDFLTNLDDDCTFHLDCDTSIYVTHVPMIFNNARKANATSAHFHKTMLTNPFTHEEYLSEFHSLVNADKCKAVIDQTDATVIVFGHNHLQAHAYCGDKLIINPGSCGLPLDFNPDAAYTILEATSTGHNVIEKRVAYDIKAIIETTKKSTLYQKGKIWCDLVFLALETGRDYFGFFFEIADEIAKSKNETAVFFSNETWFETQDIFATKYL